MSQMKLKVKYLEDESYSSTVTLKLHVILEFVPSTSNVNILLLFTVIHVKLAMWTWIDLTVSDHISF